MPQSFDLVFSGHWTEKTKGKIPARSGIYCVYASTMANTILVEPSPIPDRLLYIGESNDVRGRLANHDHLDDWQNRLKKGEVLSYTFADVDDAHRERVEAALIYHIKPPGNTKGKDSFTYDKTMINTDGKNKHLAIFFTVTPTN